MADEISKIQTAKTKPSQAGFPSSEDLSASRAGSPGSKIRTASAARTEAPKDQPPGEMDFVYLKNVLLQFLEQKDRKHQIQLIPVLGMLLHFDRSVMADEMITRTSANRSVERMSKSGCLPSPRDHDKTVRRSMTKAPVVRLPGTAMG